MLTGARTFVGFGFGAIQAGLFIKEAFASGNFARLVVAEVVPEIVAAVRKNRGNYWLNTAYADHIEQDPIGPIEILDPSIESHRAVLVEAIAQADEMATAVPSVSFYTSKQPGSIHRLLAAGLRRKIDTGGRPAVVYAAENHNHAAEALQACIIDEIPQPEQASVSAQVAFLDTVIGKMSAVVTDPAAMAQQGLAAIAPALPRAFRVEAFNHILVSQPAFHPLLAFRRGIPAFVEKEDLLPFEEAKLYGHNATHALAAYLGELCGARFIADLKGMPGMMEFLRRAFIEESGAALIRKHAGIDEIFTPAGYRAYATDLLERMTNPFLLDEVERVGRDPQRKLGWNDRLIGTIRLALQENIQPRRYALGAAAALARLNREIITKGVRPEALLVPLWQTSRPAADEQSAVLAQLPPAVEALRCWTANGFPPLESVLNSLNTV